MKNIFIFHGPNPIPARKKIKTLKSSIPPEMLALNFFSFEGSEIQAESSLSDEAATAGFGGKKIIVINHYQQIRSQKVLKNLITAVADENVLVLTRPDNKGSKTITDLSKKRRNIEIITTRQPGFHDIFNQIQNFFQKRQILSDEKTISFIADNVLNGGLDVETELEKIDLYLLDKPSPRKLDEKTVADLITSESHLNIFYEIDNLVSADYRKALKALRLMTSKLKDLFAFQRILAGHLSHLYFYKQLAASGYKDFEIFKKIPGMYPARQTKIRQAAGAFSENQLRYFLSEMIKLEEILKMRNLSPGSYHSRRISIPGLFKLQEIVLKVYRLKDCL